jgi:hypothetical protein
MTKYTIAIALSMFVFGAVVGHSTASTTVVVSEAMRASVPTFELMLMARNLPVERFDAI